MKDAKGLAEEEMKVHGLGTQKNPAQGRLLTAIDGAMALIVILLIVQMWLLTATLESFLGGHREVVLPAAIISGLIFVACLILYSFVSRVDTDVDRS